MDIGKKVTDLSFIGNPGLTLWGGCTPEGTKTDGPHETTKRL